jgi:hypothetical protein
MKRKMLVVAGLLGICLVGSTHRPVLAVDALTCTPSPLCPDSSACNVNCRSRGAHFGACTAEQCCICVWKI